MWHHTYKKLYHTYGTSNLKWWLAFCCNRCILTEGGTDQNHPRQNLLGKIPPDKPRGQNPWEQLWICTGRFCPGFCTRPTKMGVRDVWRTFGGSRDVWQSVTGGGESKLAKNSVTYFMDCWVMFNCLCFVITAVVCWMRELLWIMVTVLKQIALECLWICNYSI